MKRNSTAFSRKPWEVILSLAIVALAQWWSVSSRTATDRLPIQSFPFVSIANWHRAIPKEVDRIAVVAEPFEIQGVSLDTPLPALKNLHAVKMTDNEGVSLTYVADDLSVTYSIPPVRPTSVQGTMLDRAGRELLRTDQRPEDVSAVLGKPTQVYKSIRGCGTCSAYDRWYYPGGVSVTFSYWGPRRNVGKFSVEHHWRRAGQAAVPGPSRKRPLGSPQDGRRRLARLLARVEWHPGGLPSASPRQRPLMSRWLKRVAGPTRTGTDPRGTSPLERHTR